jgi:hypothetical protein
MRRLLFPIIAILMVAVLLGCSGPGSGINDQEAAQLMQDFLGSDEMKIQAAVDRILETNDTRFISVFIELMRARQIQLITVSQSMYGSYIETMQQLSGESHSYSWADWVEWYGRTELEPPPGFTAWKGNLFSGIDPRFSDFLRDDSPARIRVEEIQWGGVLVDGIPALDNPKMLIAEEAEYLEPEEAVFGLFLNGEPRAYPLRIMDWHEMANDVVGGMPVSLTYCTLCGAAIAYDGQASNGQTYTFSSSGLLHRSNKLMYDRQTGTLWNQLTAEPVLGELVDEEVELTILPVVLTSWQEWLAQHPQTLVLDLETGFNRPYHTGAAYGHYFVSPDTMFPVAPRSERLEDKAQIYALNIEGIPKAYPIDLLTEEQVANDILGETPVVLVATRGTVEVSGLSARYRQAVNYTAGSEVRAYERGSETFRPGPDADTVLDASGRPWEITEEALVGPGGEQAPRLGGHLAYWFGWYAFFPNTLVYGE